MNISLSDFTDVLDNNEDYNSSSPLSLSSIQEDLQETGTRTEYTNNVYNDVDHRLLKYTARCGDLRSVQEIPTKYRHLFVYQHFNIIQSKIMDDALYTDKSIVVSAPTGSGKTVVLEMTIVQLLMHLEDIQYTGDFKIIYIAPVKALCTERLTDWYAKFTQLGLLCIQVTGDTDADFCDLKPYKIIITTPEKWDMMTRRWIANKDMMEVIKLFIIDEVQLLNDNVRGPVLEAVVSRMKIIEASVQLDRRNQKLKPDTRVDGAQHLPGGIRYVAISATVDNPGDVAEWLHNPQKPAVSYKMGDECRPVRLHKVVEGYPCAPGTSPFKFDMTLGYKLWPLLEKHYTGKPTLIFCSTRRSVCMTADVLTREMTFQFNTEQKSKLINIASHILDKKLQALVLVGVGCHHAGYVFEDRYHIEQGFRSGYLPILVTTTTLAMGVNLPANLVIIKSTQQYINGAYQEYSMSTVLQMMGRAGRPQFDSEGTAIIMTRMQDKARYTSMVLGAEPLESSLHRHLAEHLNSEIALGAVVDLAVAAEWASSTFLHVRATREPRRYLGLPNDAPPQRVDKKIEDLCMVAINALSRHGMITFDEAVCVTSTDAGRLMSHYCLNLETMKLIMKMNGKETLKDMLFLVCEGHELSDSPLRVSEKTCLNALNRPKSGDSIRFQLKGKISTRQMKVNCILQSVFGCIPIPDPSLNQESIKIIRIAERITNCIVSYLTRATFTQTHPAYLAAILSAVTLAKCMSARLWEKSINVARQLRGIGPAYGSALATSGKTTFQHIRDANPRDLERIMNKGPPAGNVLKQQVSLLPVYSVHLETHTDSVQVVLRIENFEDLQRNDGTEQLTAGPQHKIYLVAGDDDNNLLMFHCLRDKQLLQNYNGTITRTFETIKSDEHTVYVYCISATYVGLDVSTQILVQSKKKLTQKVQQNITKYLQTEGDSITNILNSTHTHEVSKVSQTSKVSRTPKMTEVFKEKKKIYVNVEGKPTPKKQNCASIERLDSFREQFSLNRATNVRPVNATMSLTKQPTKYNLYPQKVKVEEPALSYDCNYTNKNWNSGKTSKNENVSNAVFENVDEGQTLITPGSSWLNNVSDSYSEWLKTMENTHIDMNFEKVDKHFDSMINDFDKHSNIDNTENFNNFGKIEKNLNNTDNNLNKFDNINNNVHDKENIKEFGKIDRNCNKLTESVDDMYNNVDDADNTDNINVDFLLEQLEEEMKKSKILKENVSQIHFEIHDPNENKCNIQQSNNESNIYDNSANILRSLKSKYKGSIKNSSFRDIMKPEVKKSKTNDSMSEKLRMEHVNQIFTQTDKLKISTDSKINQDKTKTKSGSKNPQTLQIDSPVQINTIAEKNRDGIIKSNITRATKPNISEICTNIISTSVRNCEKFNSPLKIVSFTPEEDEEMFSSPEEFIDTEIEYFNVKNTQKKYLPYNEIEKTTMHSFSNILQDKTLANLRKPSDLIVGTKYIDFINSNDTIIINENTSVSDNKSNSENIKGSYKSRSKLTANIKNYILEKKDNSKIKSIYSNESVIVSNRLNPLSQTMEHIDSEPQAILDYHKNVKTSQNVNDTSFSKIIEGKSTILYNLNKDTVSLLEIPENVTGKKICNDDDPKIKKTTSELLIPMINLGQGGSNIDTSDIKQYTNKNELLPSPNEIQSALVPFKPDLTSTNEKLPYIAKLLPKLSPSFEQSIIDSNSTQRLPFYRKTSDFIPCNFPIKFTGVSKDQTIATIPSNLCTQNLPDIYDDSSTNTQNSLYESKIEFNIKIQTITMKENVKIYRTLSEKNIKVNEEGIFVGYSKINIEKLCVVNESISHSSQIQNATPNYTFRPNRSFRRRNSISVCCEVFKNLPNDSKDHERTNENQRFSNIHKNMLAQYFSVNDNTTLKSSGFSALKQSNMPSHNSSKNIPNNEISEMQCFSNTQFLNINNRENIPKNKQQFANQKTESRNPKTIISTITNKDVNVLNIRNSNNESLNTRCKENIMSIEKPKFSEHQQLNEIFVPEPNTTTDSTTVNENKRFSNISEMHQTELLKIKYREPVVSKHIPPCVPKLSYKGVVSKIEKFNDKNKIISCMNEIDKKTLTNNNDNKGNIETELKPTEENTVTAILIKSELDPKKIPPKRIGRKAPSSNLSQKKESFQNEALPVETVQYQSTNIFEKFLQNYQAELRAKEIAEKEETSNMRNVTFSNKKKFPIAKKKQQLKHKPRKNIRIQNINNTKLIDLSKFIDPKQPILSQPDTNEMDQKSINHSNSYLNTLLNPPIPRPNGKNNRYQSVAEERKGNIIPSAIRTDFKDVVEYDGIDIYKTNEKAAVKSSSPLQIHVEETPTLEILAEENPWRYNEEEIEYYAPSSFKSMFQRYSEASPNQDNCEVFSQSEESSRSPILMSQSLTRSSVKLDHFDGIGDTFSNINRNVSSQLEYSPVQIYSETEIIPPPPQFDSPVKSEYHFSSMLSPIDTHQWEKTDVYKSTIGKSSFDYDLDDRNYAPSSLKQMFAQYAEETSNDADILLSSYNNTERAKNLEELKLLEQDDSLTSNPSKIGLVEENLNETHIRDKQNEIEFSSSNGTVCLNRSPVIYDRNKIVTANTEHFGGSNYAFTVKRKRGYDAVMDCRTKLKSFKYIKKKNIYRKQVDSSGSSTYNANNY